MSLRYTIIMENNIQLNIGYTHNSYLKHFVVAQVNLHLVIQEEPRIKQKYKRKNRLVKTIL
jgi:hypothetical protein